MFYFFEFYFALSERHTSSEKAQYNDFTSPLYDSFKTSQFAVIATNEGKPLTENANGQLELDRHQEVASNAIYLKHNFKRDSQFVDSLTPPLVTYLFGVICLYTTVIVSSFPIHRKFKNIHVTAGFAVVIKFHF